MEFERQALGTAGPRAIDIIRRAFSTTAQPYVTRWMGEDGQPLVLYFSPLTLADLETVRAWQADASLSPIDQDLKLVILKAMDAEGKPAFYETDLALLKTQAHHGAIRDLQTFVFKIGALTHDEAKDALKN